MTLKQFNEIYPNFTGLVYIDSGNYVDTKMIKHLEDLKVGYIKINIFSLDTKLLKAFEVDIGPNLFRFQNGIIVDKLQSLVNKETVNEFCSKVV